jgi:hypothetical protein
MSRGSFTLCYLIEDYTLVMEEVPAIVEGIQMAIQVTATAVNNQLDNVEALAQALCVKHGVQPTSPS